MARLERAAVMTWLSGGWAEELRGLRPPGPHHDVDLLYPAADFARVDSFLARSRKVTEITQKRFGHKRAFDADGVMVELLLLQPLTAGRHVTIFWDRAPYHWPADVLDAASGGLRVASATALRNYRADHDRLHPAAARSARPDK